MRYEFEPEKTSEKELSLSPVGEEQIRVGLSASAIKHSDLFVSQILRLVEQLDLVRISDYVWTSRKSKYDGRMRLFNSLLCCFFGVSLRRVVDYTLSWIWNSYKRVAPFLNALVDFRRSFSQFSFLVSLSCSMDGISDSTVIFLYLFDNFKVTRRIPFDFLLEILLTFCFNFEVSHFSKEHRYQLGRSR